MEQGRELDKVIAKFMGWTWDKLSAVDPSGRRYMIGAYHCNEENWAFPHYSSEMSDAWEVVEKIALMNFDVAVIAQKNKSCCRIYPKDKIIHEIIYCDSDVAIAICNATLEFMKKYNKTIEENHVETGN